MDLHEVLYRRTNTHFKFSDNIPDKELVRSIIHTAYDTTPMKCDTYFFSIDVYGPEFKDDKNILYPTTIREHTEKVYFDLQEDPKEAVRSYSLDENNHLSFNNQVLAPYLLAFRRNKKPTRRSTGVNQISTKYTDFASGTQAGMMALTIALLANEQEIDASFCGCFTKKLSFNSKILDGEKILFFLCLGYYDETKRSLINTISDLKHGRFEGLNFEYASHDFKNDINEVIHWHEAQK
jgi:hypothetical protein